MGYRRVLWTPYAGSSSRRGSTRSCLCTSPTGSLLLWQQAAPEVLEVLVLAVLVLKVVPLAVLNVPVLKMMPLLLLKVLEAVLLLI